MLAAIFGALLGALALSAALAGCGPIGYLQQVHQRAEDAVLAARRAGAERAAPYEYTAACEYLNKAKEEGGQAEYQVAIELGRRAEELAKKALVVAQRASDRGKTADARGEP